MRGGVYFQTSMITLGRKDQYLKIQNYKDEEVSLSGGFPLDLVWQKQGDILSGSFMDLAQRLIMETIDFSLPEVQT